jgi:hypothetical protein
VLGHQIAVTLQTVLCRQSCADTLQTVLCRQSVSKDLTTPFLGCSIVIIVRLPHMHSHVGATLQAALEIPLQTPTHLDLKPSNISASMPRDPLGFPAVVYPGSDLQL